ncbi:GD21698 [Drosophila simulans]|uniref:GD21698 n=1 Tax=Drosophila simulans TaxID=7240 RepID=B4Q3E1_DROSI|nr:GD21698 [Drosophila simulans]
MSNGDEVVEDDEDDEDDDDEDENEDEDHDDDNKDNVVLRTATARCHRKWPAASVSGRWAANTLHNSLSVPVLDPNTPPANPSSFGTK